MIVWLVFLAILMGGAFLRLVNLGSFGFWVDEIFHAAAARSLLENGTLYVPYEGLYTRAKPVTYIAAASIRLLGESEFAARIPFVIISLIFIGVAFVFLRRMLSTGVALIFSFVVSFAPVCVLISRECRMYAPFQLIYFLLVGVFFIGFENIPTRWKGFSSGWLARLENQWDIHLGWLGVSALLFFMSLSVHELTINFGPMVVVYCFVMFLMVGFKEGWKKSLGSKYGLVTLAAVVGFLGIALFAPEQLTMALEKVRDVPPQFKYLNPLGDTNYYRYILSDQYPALFFLYPLGVYLLIKRWGKWGVYLVLNFVILYILHSYVYERKAERYLYYIFPFFLIGFSVALEWIIGMIRRGTAGLQEAPSRASRVLFAFCTLPVLFIFIRPWAIDTLKLVRASWFTDWKNVSEERAALIQRGTVFTVHPLEYAYYYRKLPHYYFYLERNPDRQYESGLLHGFEGFKRTYDQSPEIAVLTDRYAYKNKAYFPDEMVAFIEKNMVPVENTPDNHLLVFKKPVKKS